MNLGQADLSVGPDRTGTDKSQCGVKLSHSHTDKASAGKRSGVHPDGTGTGKSQAQEPMKMVRFVKKIENESKRIHFIEGKGKAIYEVFKGPNYSYIIIEQ